MPNSKRDSQWPLVYPEDLAPRVQLASFYIIHPPFFPKYRTPGIQLCLIVEGRMRFGTSTGEGGMASAGDLVCFYAGNSEYEIIGDSPLLFYQLAFSAAPPPLHIGVPSLPDVGRLPHLCSMGSRLNECARLFERIIQSLLELSHVWHVETSAATMDLIALIFKTVTEKRARPRLRLNEWEQLLAKLEEDPAIPRVSAMAKQFGLCTESFIRKFYRYTGQTPKQYVLQRRLWKARRILQAGHLVKEASFQSGFKDPLYFSRLYKKQFGHPPSQTPEGPDFSGVDIDTSLPISRHLLAPDIDLKIFQRG